MKKKVNNSANLKPDKKEKNEFPGYPTYPESEDIYNQFQEETEINPEDISKKKITDKNEIVKELRLKDFEGDLAGSDLDIPGSELDNRMENIGNEDEENNYYSIGGDNHYDLDENGAESPSQRKTKPRKKS